MDDREYYAAYDERYKTVHSHGVSWSSDVATPIVLDAMDRYRIDRQGQILEIGCGEGRDARAVLGRGYALSATDISPEAINYCRKTMPQYASRFSVLDCLAEETAELFDFIYAVAVVHMLVREEDRDGFYRFIRKHLKPEGVALICTMGDGSFEMQSDITAAFTLQERNHPAGKMLVAGTSCRMVSFPTFEAEIGRNGLEILEQGITGSMPDFDKLMYAVVRRKD